tara:strand:- start:1146 stop:1703 length:558 start_codon:yes stop_codon:yes gene_type:complete
MTHEDIIKIIEEEVENAILERCQKGYKTHPTRKTKKMYGKTYRNCIKADERKLTDAEYEKKKEVAKAIEKDDPDMPEDKKYAIATSTAKRVAQEAKKKKAGTESSKESSLRDWFGRKGAKGKKKGWVDCNTCRKDKKTGKKTCKACGRSSGEKRSKYPSCRPTPGACGEKGRGKSWGKKSSRGKK